jgi:AcrR family transcriptional regulator
MEKKGLHREVLIGAAVNVIERDGRNNFSMKLVADELGVKTASLYNHVKNMDELLSGVCNYALRLQRDAEMQAIKDLNREQALYALSEAYRRFAKEKRPRTVPPSVFGQLSLQRFSTELLLSSAGGGTSELHHIHVGYHIEYRPQ